MRLTTTENGSQHSPHRHHRVELSPYNNTDDAAGDYFGGGSGTTFPRKKPTASRLRKHQKRRYFDDNDDDDAVKAKNLRRNVVVGTPAAVVATAPSRRQMPSLRHSANKNNENELSLSSSPLSKPLHRPRRPSPSKMTIHFMMPLSQSDREVVDEREGNLPFELWLDEARRQQQQQPQRRRRTPGVNRRDSDTSYWETIAGGGEAQEDKKKFIDVDYELPSYVHEIREDDGDDYEKMGRGQFGGATALASRRGATPQTTAWGTTTHSPWFRHQDDNDKKRRDGVVSAPSSITRSRGRFANGRRRSPKYNNSVQINSTKDRLASFLSRMVDGGRHRPATSNVMLLKLPPTINRSREMKLAVKDKFESYLGMGLWADVVGSPLARSLDAEGVYDDGIVVNRPGTALAFAKAGGRRRPERAAMMTTTTTSLGWGGRVQGSSTGGHGQSLVISVTAVMNAADDDGIIATSDDATADEVTSSTHDEKERFLLFPYSPHIHTLASILQRAYQKHYRRRVTNQIILSRTVRGHLSRQRNRCHRFYVGARAKKIQRQWRYRLTYKLFARRFTERVVTMATRTASTKRRLDTASIVIQSHARRQLARRVVSERKRFVAAVVRVQSVWRERARLVMMMVAATQKRWRVVALKLVAYRFGLFVDNVRRCSSRICALVRGVCGRRECVLERERSARRELLRGEMERNVVCCGLSLALKGLEVWMASRGGRRVLKTVGRVLSKGSGRHRHLFHIGGRQLMPTTFIPPMHHYFGKTATEKNLDLQHVELMALLSKSRNSGLNPSQFVFLHYRQRELSLRDVRTFQQLSNTRHPVEYAPILTFVPLCLIHNKISNNPFVSLTPLTTLPVTTNDNEQNVVTIRREMKAGSFHFFSKLTLGQRPKTPRLFNRKRSDQYQQTLYHEIITHAAIIAARLSQSSFRKQNPPPFTCPRCRAPFAFFKDYRCHVLLCDDKNDCPTIGTTVHGVNAIYSRSSTAAIQEEYRRDDELLLVRYWTDIATTAQLLYFRTRKGKRMVRLLRNAILRAHKRSSAAAAGRGRSRGRGTATRGPAAVTMTTQSKRGEEEWEVSKDCHETLLRILGDDDNDVTLLLQLSKRQASTTTDVILANYLQNEMDDAATATTSLPMDTDHSSSWSSSRPSSSFIQWKEKHQQERRENSSRKNTTMQFLLVSKRRRKKRAATILAKRIRLLDARIKCAREVIDECRKTFLEKKSSVGDTAPLPLEHENDAPRRRCLDWETVLECAGDRTKRFLDTLDDRNGHAMKGRRQRLRSLMYPRRRKGQRIGIS